MIFFKSTLNPETSITESFGIFLFAPHGSILIGVSP